MRAKRLTTNFFLLIVLLSFFVNSCILDEYKFDEVKFTEDWDANIVVPLLYGSFSFPELIQDSLQDTPVSSCVVVEKDTSVFASYFPVDSIEDQTLAIKKYNLIELEGQEYFKSATFKVVAHNSLKTDIDITFYLYDIDSCKVAFNIPADTTNYVDSLVLDDGNLESFREFVYVDFTSRLGKYRKAPLVNDTIFLDDQFSFSLIVQGVMDKTNYTNE